MEELKKQFDKIPWSSFGRETPISNLARSLVAVGNLPTPLEPGSSFANDDPGFEDALFDIVGTAFQVGRGKLLSCWHVCEDLKVEQGQAHLLGWSAKKGVRTYFPIMVKFNFIDPRTNRGNSEVDAGILLSGAEPGSSISYDVPSVRWGDSTKIGVGDRVLIGGYPLGRLMFLTNTTNRAIFQPTFFDGVISAVIPATSSTETRLFQISTISLGGISGGVVCNANDGRVIGMVTNGFDLEGVSLPVTYAIPSEVLHPWADAVNFRVQDELWR